MNKSFLPHDQIHLPSQRLLQTPLQTLPNQTLAYQNNLPLFPLHPLPLPLNIDKLKNLPNTLQQLDTTALHNKPSLGSMHFRSQRRDGRYVSGRIVWVVDPETGPEEGAEVLV